MRALIAATLLLPTSALAQATVNVPQVMGYQGRLVKADGGPVTGSAENPRQVNIIFRIHDQEVGGTLKWTEAQRVLLTNGFYAVFLGSQEPFPPDLFDGNLRWLELEIEGDSMPLTPRQQIGSVAYAMTAGRALNVSGGGTVNASSVNVGTASISGNATLGPLSAAATTVASLNVDGAAVFRGPPTYAADPGSGNVLTRRSYVDTRDTATLASANSHSDAAVSSEATTRANGDASALQSARSYADALSGRVVGGCKLQMNGVQTALQGGGCEAWGLADCSTVSCSSAGCTDPRCPSGSDRVTISHGNCYCGGQGYCRNYLCIQR